MTSPCNSSSSSTSPYTPQTPTSSPSQPTTPDNEQPCCSRSLSTTAPATSPAAKTAAKAKRTTKRKFSETSSSSEEEGASPRKCQKKTRHLEPLSPPTSPQKTRKRSSRACLKNPLNERPWQIALRCRDSRYKKLKTELNKQFLQQLQQECLQAVSELDDLQKQLASTWNDLAQSAPEATPAPIILFKRLLRRPSRLNWEKLTRAVSMLTTESKQRLGDPTAGKVTKWLKYFFKNLEGNLRPRHLICGSNFTRLCGQAISAQEVPLAQQNETRLTPTENRTCFLSVDDLARAISDPNVLSSEHSVVFLRHQDEPRHSTNQQENGSYPIQEFEHNNSSQ